MTLYTQLCSSKQMFEKNQHKWNKKPQISDLDEALCLREWITIKSGMNLGVCSQNEKDSKE